MNGTLELIIGVFSLSSFLAYAWWTKVRVWMLRQDLFEIRDRLWDRMRAEGLLDHPAHRWYRNNLNALIRFAPALSWLLILTVLSHDTDLTPTLTGLKVEHDELPKPVSEASEEVVNCIVRYLFRWTLTGWVLWVVLSVIGKLRTLQSRVISTINHVSRSEEMRKVGRQLART